uniref:3-ketoacyl-CoA synthase n=1 Tax=Salix viminalis TaxID=40686 RepID=A0A6N2KBX3_SALVM
MELFLVMLPLLLYYIIFSLFRLGYQKRDKCCYMISYECYKASDDQILDPRSSAKVIQRNKNLGVEEYKFMLKTMVSSGIGEGTYGPKSIIDGKEESPTIVDEISEMDDIIFGTLDKLFAKTGVSPSEIDIVVSAVSLLSPAPSLTARVMNRYKMREDTKTFNLSGMGCSASVVAVDLVNQLFQTYKNSLAIVISTESMGPNWYSGKDKSMMLSNILFRIGGCSMLLTNNRKWKNKALLELTCSVRTHIGSHEEAYKSCFQIEDDLGKKGFRLNKDLPKAGARALNINLRILVPKVMPFSVMLRYYISHYGNKIMGRSIPKGAGPGLDLKAGIDHFCVHPGGRAIIDEVGQSLALSDYDLEPARMALYRFGNTSSGGLWYVLGYMEAKKRLKKGDKILMISLGAGFKCNNCVWKVLKDLDDPNVWQDCIDDYPPKTTGNPFSEKFDWINDGSLDLATREDYLPLLSKYSNC